MSSSVLSTQGNSNKGILGLYPNPASTEINFTAKENQTVEIYAMDGKLVKSIEVKKGDNKIDVSGLQTGNYILKTKDGSQKLIKR